jgi:hypothetical protein
MDLDKTISDRVEEKQLVWYGHLQRMSEERWPKKIWEWTPHGRRRRGRPRRTWSNNIKEAMTARDLDDQDIQDRSRWRRGCKKRPQSMSEERWPKRFGNGPHKEEGEEDDHEGPGPITKEAMAGKDLDEQDIQDRSRWRRGCEKRPQRM